MKKIFLIFLLLPVFLHAQRIADGTSMQQITTNPQAFVSPGSASFFALSPAASAAQTITYSFLNTTAASDGITVPTPWEGSVDGGSTWHSAFSGLSNCVGCTMLVRIAASTTVGPYGPLNLAFTSTTGGFTGANCALSGTVGSVSASPTSITGLNGVSGTAGATQTVTVTFSNATVVATAPSKTEISSNGGSSYGPTQTFSTGSPLALLIRVAASASTGSVSGNLNLTPDAGVDNVNVSVAGTVSPSSAKDSMRVQIYITATDTVAGWSHCLGDPSTGTRSVVGGNTGTITYTEGMTTAFWGQSGGACIGANNGLTSTTTWNYATGVMREGVLNTNAYDTTKHMAQFSGLVPGATYKVALSGVTQYNFNFAGRYDVGGTSWGTFQTLNCNGTTNPNPVQLSWTVVANSAGIVYIAMGADPGTPGSLAGLMNAITITQQ